MPNLKFKSQIDSSISGYKAEARCIDGRKTLHDVKLKGKTRIQLCSAPVLPCLQPHIWAKCQKNHHEIDSKIREIDWSYLSLQQFDKFWIWIVCNDPKRKLSESSEICLEKFVKLHQVNLFSAGFCHFEPLWACAVYVHWCISFYYVYSFSNTGCCELI